MDLRFVMPLAAAACSSHAAHRYDPPRPAPAPAATNKPVDCKAATDELGKFLTTMDHEGSLLDLSQVSPPVRGDLTIAGRELQQGPAIEIRRDGIYFEGEFRVAETLLPVLENAQKRIQHEIDAGHFPRSYKPDPRYIIVVADDKALWEMVEGALDAAAKAQFDHVTFVFRRPPATTPPPRNHVDDEIEKVLAEAEPGNKATALARYIKPKIALCPPLMDVFGEVSSTEMIEDKAGYMLNKTGPALAACNCALDPAEARSLMWQFLGNPKPTTLLRVELDRKAKPITAPANQPWGEASAKLTADTKTMWLTATPARR